MKYVKIYTDGACQGNPGPGGWAALLHYQAREKMISGGETPTTNNRMELMAAIQALKTLKEPCEVELTTDSEYVRQGIMLWIHTWKKRQWRTAGGDAVKNVDLWKELLEVSAPHKIVWKWIKGHSGHLENERVDQAARAAIPTGRTII